MNKSILMLGILLLAAGTLATAVDAAENVNINGENLKVLDGFKAYESDVDTTHMDDGGLDVEDIDGTRVDNKVTREYINSNGDKLELTVGVLNNGKPVQALNAYGYTKKVINGKDGYFKTEMDDGRQQYKFQYIKDGKLVKIEAPSEDSIGKVMT